MRRGRRSGASGGACSLLVGVGDGRSPPFVLPRCVLAFVVGRGWWWVLVLALALVGVAWLCAPVRHWWWVLAPARVASLGARDRCLRGMVVGACARPRCALPLVMGAQTRSCGLVGCSCPPLVGDNSQSAVGD